MPTNISKRKGYKDAVTDSQLDFTRKSLFLSVAVSLLDTGLCSTQGAHLRRLSATVAASDKWTLGRLAAPADLATGQRTPATHWKPREVNQKERIGAGNTQWTL